MKHKYSFYYALLSTAVAVIFSITFIAVFGSNEPDKLLLLVFGTIGSGISGFSWWHLLMERRGIPSVRRAILPGALTVVTSHFCAFYFMIVYYYLCNALTGGCLNSLKERPADPLTGLLVALGFTGLSLIFFVGWITLPAGILASVLFQLGKVKLKKTTGPPPDSA